MRLRLWNPVDGWAGFVTELVIVVLGVLIALGAQQALDNMRWRGDVREFRAAVDAEIGHNLGSYIDRMKQSACINRRLDQLDRWHQGVSSGARPRLTSRIGRPTTIGLRTSVWQSRTPEITAHLGLEQRLTYTFVYDTWANHQSIIDRERQVWTELLDFEGAATLDPRDLLRLRGLIERGRVTSQLIDGNWPPLNRYAAKLGARPRWEKDYPPTVSVCKPLTWEAG